MKKVFILMAMVILTVFIFSSCGDEDPTLSNNEKNDDMSQNDDNQKNDIEEQQDIESSDDLLTDAEEKDEANIVPDETQDNNIEKPDETSFAKVGEFNLNFNGPVNTTIDQNSKGGNGETNFTHIGTPYKFGKLTIAFLFQLFPIAVVQQGNVIIMWLESAPGLGAETKKVFGFSFPSTIQAGNQTMEAVQAFAFFGDIDINIQGGQFNVKCIRSASNAGNLNVASYTGTNVDISSSGDMLDPEVAASQLGFAVCTD